jgi:nicotinamidase-related amidase
MNAVDPKRTAVLAMDFQTTIVARLAGKGGPAVERAAGVVTAARQAGIPIIYVVVGFRPGYPELSPKNPNYARLTQNGEFTSTPPGADVVPELRPEAGDIVVVKHRVSAFSGTDLDMVLRTKGIDTLVLFGLATSGVVLSTVRHAADADYQLIVVKDACGDADDEVHRVLTEKVFARQTTVVLASEFESAVRAG